MIRNADFPHLIEVRAGRMRHLWDGEDPNMIPLCGAYRMYVGTGIKPTFAQREDLDRRHLCKTCEGRAKGEKPFERKR